MLDRRDFRHWQIQRKRVKKCIPDRERRSTCDNQLKRHRVFFQQSDNDANPDCNLQISKVILQYIMAKKAAVKLV